MQRAIFQRDWRARLESRLIMKSGQKLAALSKSLELAELA